MTINQCNYLMSSLERSILECLNLPDTSSSLLYIYYIIESMTIIRPNLDQTLLAVYTSQKVKHHFLNIADKQIIPDMGR